MQAAPGSLSVQSDGELLLAVSHDQSLKRGVMVLVAATPGWPLVWQSSCSPAHFAEKTVLCEC